MTVLNLDIDNSGLKFLSILNQDKEDENPYSFAPF